MMESNGSYNHEKSSIKSSEEFKQQENMNLGTKRSYECVFCKRGFNTAQALGGHMNIHRKDRSKNKPSNKQNTPILHHRHNHHHHFATRDHRHQPHGLKCATDFPTSSSMSCNTPLMYEDDRHRHRHHGGPRYDNYRQPSIDHCVLARDLSMSLSLDFSQDLEKNRQVRMNQKEDLDLELRLGYDS